MGHLQESPVCPHCGERWIVERKKNSSGDSIVRGLCPSTPSQMANIPNVTATEWERER